MRPARDAGVADDLIVEPAPAGGGECGGAWPCVLAVEEVVQFTLDAFGRPQGEGWRAVQGAGEKRSRLADSLVADPRQLRGCAGWADRHARLDLQVTGGHKDT